MIRFFITFSAAVLALASFQVQAEQPSYNAKKQGRVSFESQKAQADEANAVMQGQPTEAASPQAIEPAAGGTEETSASAKTDESSLARDMKLPRKN